MMSSLTSAGHVWKMYINYNFYSNVKTDMYHILNRNFLMFFFFSQMSYLHAAYYILQLLQFQFQQSTNDFKFVSTIYTIWLPRIQVPVTKQIIFLYKSTVSNIYLHVYMDTNLNRQTLFSRVDKDRSGQISVNELQTALSNGKIVLKKG